MEPAHALRVGKTNHLFVALVQQPTAGLATATVLAVLLMQKAKNP